MTPVPEIFVGPSRRRRRQQGPKPVLVISDGCVLDEYEQLMLLPVAQLKLPPRIVNRLEEHEVYTIGDLASLERYDFDSMRHCGETAVRECSTALDRLGIEHDDWGVRPVR